MPDASLGGRDTHPGTVREHLSGHSLLPPWTQEAGIWNAECSCGAYMDALSEGGCLDWYSTHLEGQIRLALAQLDAAVATETRIKTPSGFFLWKPARTVLDWTPGSNEPPAHGWPDPVASSPGAPRSNT